MDFRQPSETSSEVVWNSVLGSLSYEDLENIRSFRVAESKIEGLRKALKRIQALIVCTRFEVLERYPVRVLSRS